ncbi:MAG: hypothetical protein KDA66_11865 [Planctomycetaceae bacterium]|nr:hypothetical protein [Planctomycetaceae bacterium]
MRCQIRSLVLGCIAGILLTGFPPSAFAWQETISLPAPQVSEEPNVYVPPPLLLEDVPANAESLEEIPVSPNVEFTIPPSRVFELEPFDESSMNSDWLKPFSSEHLAFWREHRGGLTIVPMDSQGFGITEYNMDGYLGIEPNSDTVISAIPHFSWAFISGPTTPDVDPQLYDLSLGFNVAKKLSNVVDIHLQFKPTFATDWDNKAGDAFRFIGAGVVAFHLTPTLQLSAGATYLDRPDLPAIPLGGLRWAPRKDVELDAIFPSPRFSFRYASTEEKSHWLFVGGELGGGSWAIDHTSGLNDRLSYRDIRLTVGSESRDKDGNREVLEFGYVFDRHLDFQRFPGDQKLGGTAIIRWGSRF